MQQEKQRSVSKKNAMWSLVISDNKLNCIPYETYLYGS